MLKHERQQRLAIVGEPERDQNGPRLREAHGLEVAKSLLRANSFRISNRVFALVIELTETGLPVPFSLSSPSPPSPSAISTTLSHLLSLFFKVDNQKTKK